MSVSLILAFIWAIAGTITAFLPMRLQMVPGLTLLVTAPVLLVFLAREHGTLITLICVAAFLSLFRRPLIYFGQWGWRRLRGLPPPPRPDRTG